MARPVFLSDVNTRVCHALFFSSEVNTRVCHALCFFSEINTRVCHALCFFSEVNTRVCHALCFFSEVNTRVCHALCFFSEVNTCVCLMLLSTGSRAASESEAFLFLAFLGFLVWQTSAHWASCQYWLPGLSLEAEPCGTCCGPDQSSAKAMLKQDCSHVGGSVKPQQVPGQALSKPKPGS